MPTVSDLIQLGSRNDRPKRPEPADLQLKFSDKAVAQLDSLRGHYPEEKACVLPGLWIAQREYDGTLSPEAIAEVAHRLNRSFAEVEGVATFYSMYNTGHAPGKHVIEVCTCLSCHMCGAYRVADSLKEKLGIEFGETTEDGLFTLHEVECLNACDRAPLIQVGDEYIGPVTEADVDKLLTDLKSRPERSSVQISDEIVKVHLQADEA
jgi:NADH-quinone oxidoreductase subunit E